MYHIFLTYSSVHYLKFHNSFATYTSTAFFFLLKFRLSALCFSLAFICPWALFHMNHTYGFFFGFSFSSVLFVCFFTFYLHFIFNFIFYLSTFCTFFCIYFLNRRFLCYQHCPTISYLQWRGSAGSIMLMLKWLNALRNYVRLKILHLPFLLFRICWVLFNAEFEYQFL